jgi:LPS sulfotransferase NodH
MDYFLCTTPRVGSNLLTSLLLHTGLAGDAREFFCTTQIEHFGREFCGFEGLAQVESNLNAYYEALRANFRVGGRFGIKLHYKQFMGAISKGFELEPAFPQRLVYLTRGDVVAQAISRARAVQTGVWLGDGGQGPDPRFDPDLILRAVREQALENEAWESFFRTVDIEPYRLSYERLCADMPGQLAGILRFLDVDPDQVDLERAVELGTQGCRPQRDELNEDWRRRYESFLLERARLQAQALSQPAGTVAPQSSSLAPPRPST